MKVLRLGIIFGAVLLAIFISRDGIRDAWQWNRINLQFIKGQDVTIYETPTSCRHFWLIGVISSKNGDTALKHQILKKVLECSPVYISLVQTIMPDDQGLARLAIQYYPDSSEAWFWFGESIADPDPSDALQAYLRTVELAPYNGLAWCRVGYAYEQINEFEMATNAFLQCCLFGDPGNHGCFGAGRMMEELGNIPQAITYYRYSDFDKALKRADELEKQITP